MGRLRSGGPGITATLAAAIFSLGMLAACGGGTKAGAPLFPGRVNLTPTVNTSMVLGGTQGFIASVQTASGTTLNTTVTYSSSDTSILNLSANGVACAGHWDALFTTCTPGNVGVVQVTASALGGTSVPTYVFVHPAVDSITVTGILPDGVPPQEPCLSQTQFMTLEAHAFSQGNDVTASVGPFTWSANNASVVNLIPINDTAYNFPTSQVKALALNPGIAHIYATASGVSSTTFQQPQYSNSSSQLSPVLDFFSTCPIQSIDLELGTVGSAQTSFLVTKGTAQTVNATLTDIMGVSSLPNTNGGPVLSKIPLNWTSSRPGVLAIPSGCLQSCSASPQPGSVNVTASCTPPSCNVGFPEIPDSLSTPAQVDACTQFFHAQFPTFQSCQQLIPVPVYASTAISGTATGDPVAGNIFATSTGCAQMPPQACTTSAYYLSTEKSVAGGENPLPTAPNSFLFDPAGAKIFMGSEFGAQTINPTNFGTSNSPFISLGTVTGTILAASNNGLFAVYTDTLHTPNQVYVVNLTNANAPSTTALSITAGDVAAFSPDGLKTYIMGGPAGSSLYIYSTLQSLQGPIALAGPARAAGFSPNSAFGFIAEGGSSPNVTAFATCNNQVATDNGTGTPVPFIVPLPASPILMQVLPNVHIDGRDSYGYPIPDGIHIFVLDSTGFDIVTATVVSPNSGTLCPQGLVLHSNDPVRKAQRIELGQGTMQPINFFASPDGTQLYVVNNSSSTILAYNSIAGSVIGGIELANDANPLSADATIDTGVIMVAGSDGMLHQVSTSLTGADLFQIPFPNLPNYLNPFCTAFSGTGACALNAIAVKP
ncbi:MAG TPA: hypothetical protein VGG04_00175 [Candidatus Sulfotelmatobacter sp.]|jgi:hypothetical protein